MEFQTRLQRDIDAVERALQDYLSDSCGQGYDRIFEAARYSVLAGGKRLRPVLVLAFCRSCGGEDEQALPFACALELIHTYSLIHDDLPCMDNDDLRRGRPTSHKVFGEATAVLTGDGLLTRAFEIMAQHKSASPQTTLQAISYLARAAGMHGMIGGQVLDMLSENQQIDIETLKRLQTLKTGRLLQAAAVLGCMAAERLDEETLRQAEAFGAYLGLAFQMQDDLLDIEGDSQTLGKTIGKDEKSGKSTFPSLLGAEKCRKLITEMSGQALDALSSFENTAFLGELVEKLIDRVK